MPKSATLTLQQWGNSLAVRIPAAVARSARLKVGQPVEVSAQDSKCVGQVLGRGAANARAKTSGVRSRSSRKGSHGYHAGRG